VLADISAMNPGMFVLLGRYSFGRVVAGRRLRADLFLDNLTLSQPGRFQIGRHWSIWFFRHIAVVDFVDVAAQSAEEEAQYSCGSER
jgi:hypothetical protein